MKPASLFGFCIGLYAISPLTVMAQTGDGEMSFSRTALPIGLLILTVILLVFFALMLMARVNELRSFYREDAPKHKPVSANAKRLMSLEESEIDFLLLERKQKLQIKKTN